MATEKIQLEKEFEEKLSKDTDELRNFMGSYESSDPLNVPERIWQNLYWDFMDPQIREKFLTKLLRHTIHRAMKVMPVYKNSESYSGFDVNCIQTLADLKNLPVLLKDGSHGFRSKVGEDPHILMPDDAKTSQTFFSGGTMGISTPVFITDKDVIIEAGAQATRGFWPGGIDSTCTVFNCYNPTHKGGKIIETAMKMLGIKNLITRRPEDDLNAVVSKIKSYKVDTIAAVQPPINADSVNRKGVSFLNIYAQDSSLFGRDGQIKRAFLTGFMIPQEVINLAEDIGLELFTTWGSSEAIPGCTSVITGPSDRLCKYNHQHLMYGPHIISIMKVTPQGLVPAQDGEEGIMLITTIAREGTIFLNYAIGDAATIHMTKCPCGRTTPVISSIRRMDNPAEIEGGGCRLC